MYRRAGFILIRFRFDSLLKFFQTDIAGTCDESRKCTNTEGSYNCDDCADGFELDAWYEKDCLDIDEW